MSRTWSSWIRPLSATLGVAAASSIGCVRLDYDAMNQGSGVAGFGGINIGSLGGTVGVTSGNGGIGDANSSAAAGVPAAFGGSKASAGSNAGGGSPWAGAGNTTGATAVSGGADNSSTSGGMTASAGSLTSTGTNSVGGGPSGGVNSAGGTSSGGNAGAGGTSALGGVGGAASSGGAPPSGGAAGNPNGAGGTLGTGGSIGALGGKQGKQRGGAAGLGGAVNGGTGGTSTVPTAGMPATGGSGTGGTPITGCNSLVDLFPVAPITNASTPFGDTDDAFLYVMFPSGYSFPFYGTQYSGIYLNTNGGLTFGAGDDWFTADVTFHDQPSIAVFWTDMDAAANGADQRPHQMTYQACADRFVVTYNQLQDWYQASWTCSATVNLYLDGRIEIQYGTVIDQEILVGIFDGTHSRDRNVNLTQAPFAPYSAFGSAVILFDPKYDGSGTLHQGELSGQTIVYSPY